jgi:hypothetical protein
MNNKNGVEPHCKEGQFWFAELVMLLSRHSGLGIGADVHVMCLDELHGLYRFLARK